ncbi:MAG: hypothetical protein KH703_09550 [Campylobacter gracilis]|uniref:hypothetical protein n=1 Tax=Campylobacter gracilis TaxID=824 RepID=UPI0026EB8228|nr:hypothetical protein [Campylobacter gracilis]MBS6153614.1 hypothetical protein [Campylobacter gracilis]
MKFKFLLCIDDTDELGDEVSTGLLAEEIAAFAGSFAPVSFVTRHQLLLDPSHQLHLAQQLYVF